MISIRNYESLSGMDNYSSIEGCIRQSTNNPEGYVLKMLRSGDEKIGKEIVRRGDFVYVTTANDAIPVYAFRMDKELQRMLAEYRGVWDV